jgi:hypothetical protein
MQTRLAGPTGTAMTKPRAIAFIKTKIIDWRLLARASLAA